MNNQDEERLVTLALEKQSLIESFLQLTQEQSEVINNYNYESILSIINKKQHIIEKVNLLDLNNPGISSGVHEDLQRINTHIRELMSQAIALEDQNILALKEQQRAIFEKLQNIKQNKLTHLAYQEKKFHPEGVLIDRKK